MVTLNRVRVTWTGLPGGPGVTTHFFDTSATPPLAQIRTAYANLVNFLPGAVTLQVQPTGDQIDALTGKITGDWAGTAVAAVSGGVAAAYSAAVGGVVDWKTSAIVLGRRLRGRTFIVPLISSSFTSSGVLTAGAITALQSFATGMMPGTGPAMQIWSRPVVPTPQVPNPKNPRSGQASIVVANVVPSLTAVMRSRRDA
jgi:hypothetical protein